LQQHRLLPLNNSFNKIGHQNGMKLYATILLLCIYSVPVNSEPLHVKIMTDFIPQADGSPENEATEFVLAAATELGNKISLQFVPGSQLQDWKQLSQLPDVCLLNKLKTPEREASAIFTRYPLMAFPENKLIVFNKPTLPNSISLTDAVNYYDLTIGVTSRRSYSAKIDDFIKRHEEHFFKVDGAANAIQLGYMLFENKIDAIFEYKSMFIHRYQRAHGIDKIRYLTIEPSEPAAFGYIACSPSPQGKQAIALFEHALQTEKIKTLISTRLMELFPAPDNTLIVDAFNAAYKN